MTKWRNLSIAMAGITLLTVVGIIAMQGPQEDKEQEAREINLWMALRDINNATRRTTPCKGCLRVTKNTIACVSRTAFFKLGKLLTQGDREAAGKMTGCTILSKDTAVYLDGYEMNGGIARIRPKGETYNLWVMSDSVSK